MARILVLDNTITIFTSSKTRLRPSSVTKFSILSVFNNQVLTMVTSCCPEGSPTIPAPDAPTE